MSKPETNVVIKVCGLMNEQDIMLCRKYNVDRMGLVTEFPTPVPWNISREKAAELRKFIPQDKTAVVVTGGSPDTIMDIASLVRPDMVQIHFKGSLDIMKELIARLHAEGIGVIGKFPGSEKDMLGIFGSTDIKSITELIALSGADEILIDPRNTDNAAEKKLSADTNLVRTVKNCSKIPVILAGGITPENMMDKLSESEAEYVDIMNGSENSPGEKSEEKIRTLCQLLGK